MLTWSLFHKTYLLDFLSLHCLYCPGKAAVVSAIVAIFPVQKTQAGKTSFPLIVIPPLPPVQNELIVPLLKSYIGTN